ncbi:4-oxalocrotonate tautomerase [Saccharophagus sp. K07]|jgi:4-oxalocrotonate tautomerase|uniref:tautomerase family protein n=1 Tax=Saccharophagus sp. K07 TaxID=2283636 RepID=UPI00165249F0|nr:2-hydroxymuconate tautomerase family protein [Saccharophagus sp. K07]MBC6906679.1 4-oxalocrotonate tautomerase [Saccharophagus sp. K07]
MPIIRVELLEGRTLAQKQELAEVLSRETARIADCRLESITVVIDEVKRENWAVAGKLLAQN